MDLTIIYITANKISDYTAHNMREQLSKVKGSYPIISVSHKPINFGNNICVGELAPSAYNIYKQILIGAKEAETDYIGIAEDDVLYSPDHFHKFRPELDTFAYNLTKWSLYTWTNPPIYSFKERNNNTSLIAPRKALIEALEERYEKYPNENDYPIRYWGEIGRRDKQLGVARRKTVEFWSRFPNIVFSHEEALGYSTLGKKKRHGIIKAYDIPYWGKAKDILKLWKKS